MLRFSVVLSTRFFPLDRLVAHPGPGACATFVQCGGRRFERNACWRLRLWAKLNVLGFASQAGEIANCATRI